MYLFFGVLFFVFICCLLLAGIIRKRHIIRKICCMSCEERCCKVNEIISPFGYCYDCCEGVFSTRIDAWQRDFGFRTLYDRTAPAFHMIYDCEPVYFDYMGKTWLIEFWKGQYGINTGGEIGVYKANMLVSPGGRSHILFHSVDNDEMLKFTIKLKCGQKTVFNLEKWHWWLAGFSLGMFTCPESLQLDISILFPDYIMLHAFLNAMYDMGYGSDDFCICGHTVSFIFDRPHRLQPRFLMPIRAAYAQWMNRTLCRLFQWVTKPFCSQSDKVLYMYYYLPFVFRRLLCCKKERKWKRHG